MCGLAAIMQARCGSQRLSRGSWASRGVGRAPTPNGEPRSGSATSSRGPAATFASSRSGVAPTGPLAHTWHVALAIAGSLIAIPSHTVGAVLARDRARLDRRRRDRRHLARPPPHARAREPERDRDRAQDDLTAGQADHHRQLRRRPRRARLPRRVAGDLRPASQAPRRPRRPAGSPGSRSRPRGCW